MCLEVLVQLADDAAGRLSARRLAALSGLVVRTGKLEGKPAFQLSVSGGCSCEFLASDASSDEPIWDLEAQHLPKLEAAVLALSSEAHTCRLLLHWLGGETDRGEEQVTSKEMIKLVQTNRVANNVLYLIGR